MSPQRQEGTWGQQHDQADFANVLMEASAQRFSFLVKPREALLLCARTGATVLAGPERRIIQQLSEARSRCREKICMISSI